MTKLLANQYHSLSYNDKEKYEKKYRLELEEYKKSKDAWIINYQEQYKRLSIMEKEKKRRQNLTSNFQSAPISLTNKTSLHNKIDKQYEDFPSKDTISILGVHHRQQHKNEP